MADTATNRCHFCGERVAEQTSGDGYGRLAAHLVADCPAVPERVRMEVSTTCPGGRCPY